MNFSISKVLLLLVLVFVMQSIYAQEQKKAIVVEWDQKPIEDPRLDPVDELMRPRWVVPCFEIRPHGYKIKIGIVNIEMNTAVTRLFFIDSQGKMVYSDEISVKGRENQIRIYDVEQLGYNIFFGYLMMEATSPNVFMSAFYTPNLGVEYIPYQVFRVEP